jgi:hypothetical protein
MDLSLLRSLKIMVLTTVCGGVLKIICRRYIKNNPEFLEKKSENLKEVEPGIKNKRRFRIKNKRTFRIKNKRTFRIKNKRRFRRLAKFSIKFLAENGLIVGLVSGTSIVVSSIPTTVFIAYLREASIHNLLELERKKFILVDGKKIYLDQCDQNIKYLVIFLSDETLSFKEKRSILTKYLNLNTADDRVTFVICIIFILYVFSTKNMYHTLNYKWLKR